MKKWKVVVNINNYTEQKTVFVKGDTKEEVYYEAKRYFIEDRPEIDFCNVESAVII